MRKGKTKHGLASKGDSYLRRNRHVFERLKLGRKGVCGHHAQQLMSRGKVNLAITVRPASRTFCQKAHNWYAAKKMNIFDVNLNT